MPIDSGYAEVNGTRLYYEVAGVGQPLVLVHGFALDASMWDDQFEQFARRYRVLRYDMRGFGRSAEYDDQSYYHHEDLRALLEYLGMGRSYVVGLSMGGAVALEFALAYPDMLGALLLADSIIWGFESPLYETLGPIWEAGRTEGVEAAKRLWLAHPQFAPGMSNARVAPRLRQMAADYSGIGWTKHDPGLVPDPAAVHHLEQIAAPTLVMVGERDLADYHVIADSLTSWIPGARKVEVPGAGHMSNMENPQAFNDAVFAFLGSL